MRLRAARRRGESAQTQRSGAAAPRAVALSPGEVRASGIGRTFCPRERLADCARSRLRCFLAPPLSSRPAAPRFHPAMLRPRPVPSGDGTDRACRSREAPVATCPPASRGDGFLARLGHIIDAELSSTAFGVETLADALALSSRHLSRRLAALSGETPAEAIRRRRLARAATLLAEDRLSVEEIMRAVGFTSPSGFRRAFRAAYGVTPSACRVPGGAGDERAARAVR